jgi:hypothetical protein
MHRLTVRTVLAITFVGAACLASSPRPEAAPSTGAVTERFVGRAPSESDPAGSSYIEIVIQRWSTDDERDSLCGTLVKDGPGALLAAVHKVLQRPAGVVLIPGIPGAGARVRTRQARNVVFARAVDTPKGRQVIIAADQYLAFGEPTLNWSSEYEFTLLDIRFGADGTGVGKLARPGKVVYNKNTKSIEIDDYAAQPVRLADVRSEKAFNGSRGSK